MKDGLTIRRLEAIRDILSSRPIQTQEALCASLAEKGFDETQSNVSRDLQRLGAIKVGGYYTLVERAFNPFRNVLSAEAAGPYLLILKTSPGLANMVAVQLDGSDWPEIVGTVAGDDTIFVATASGEHQASLVAKLRKGGMA